MKKQEILKDIFSQTPPEILYHYTTQTGLLGIIKDEEIWATHTQYLNDQREYLYAVEMVKDEIDIAMDKAANRQHKTILKDMADDLEGVEKVNVCVCSFSEDGDSLPQWRAYGAAASGFAIGLSGETLATIAAKKGFYIGPCLYELSKQRNLIRALVKIVLEQNIKGTPWNNGNHIPQGGNLRAYLHQYAPILKDPSFKEEREWRVISYPLGSRFRRFDFRPGGSMLTPYYRFALTHDDIPFNVRKVIIGPTPHPEQAKGSVTKFLSSRELRNVLVKNSKVPYRNW